MKITKLPVTPAQVAASLARTERATFINAQIAKGKDYGTAVRLFDVVLKDRAKAAKLAEEARQAVTV